MTFSRFATALLLVLPVTGYADTDYAAEFSHLYAQASGEYLAYHKGTQQSRGIARYEALQRQLHRHNAQHADALSEQILEAMVIMEIAAAHHSLQSLLDLKHAADLLEHCCISAASAENAVAHALLGIIYFKVPPDPLGFGDKRVARVHFEQAFNADQSGALPNYYYGLYLTDNQEPDEARHYFELARKGSLPAGLSRLASVVESDVTAQLQKLTAPSSP